MRWPSWVRACIWRTRWGSRRSRIGGSKTISVTLQILRACCGWGGCRTRGSPPPETRELRELVRHRAKLVAMRSQCKAHVHAVLAKGGIWVPMTDLFGVEGNLLLDKVTMPAPYRERIASLRWFIEGVDAETGLFSALVQRRLSHDAGYIAVQQIPGIGPVLAAVFVAAIGGGARPSNR